MGNRKPRVIVIVLIRAACSGFSRRPPVEFNRRQNLLMRARWAIMYWDDAVPEDASEKWYVPEKVEDALRWICTTLKAHEPEDDQCMRSEHRFCVICSASTPNATTRRVTW